MKLDEIFFTLEMVNDEGKLIKLDEPISLYELLDGYSFTDKDGKESLRLKDLIFMHDTNQDYELIVEL